MIFLPSDYCCRLNDQQYMELVFENGQILAKGQRSNVSSIHNQRTKTIMDLYEAEYNEDFMKSIIIHDDVVGAIGDAQVVPQNHVVAALPETTMLETNKHVDDSTLIETLKSSSSKRVMVDYDNRKKIKFLPPDEQSVVAERTVGSEFDASSSAGFTEDSEASTYLSSSLDDETDDARPRRVPARTRKALVKRKRNAEAYDSPERKQRNDINKKLRTLQDLLPNYHKDDNESMLDEAINYMTNLQLQVQMMTMGNRFVTPSMMLPLGSHYSQMSVAMGMGMQMGASQFRPAPVLGAGLPGINNSANTLTFLNHPGLMPMQNSAPPFTTTEQCSPQSVPPSCATFPNQISNPTFLSNSDGATLHKKSRTVNRWRNSL
ncbi:PREDICTED: LOW QUALITY PROTEIN: transcription factor PIF6-like [Camelina sativa]|uniref:LOW QUALITY PROTEIN: transcription factor PIF6-like n=1 Tax=Camelina sativa TaxID=90675 RepID=A0ABM1R243_CAMSA|nr:PREDICTED: LOW QUALITY PROTEIN: transcription factor PIF6-like [Camelina sativa]